MHYDFPEQHGYDICNACDTRKQKCHGEHKNKNHLSKLLACMHGHSWSLQYGQFIGLALVGKDIMFRFIIEYNS